MNDLATQIANVYEKEAHDAKVTHASQVPPSYDAITPEWLTDVLCKDLPGAAVIAHELDERDDGTSNRRRIFLHYNEAGKEAGLPASVFCKATESLNVRLVSGISDSGRIEADFYNKVRPRLSIEAPIPVYARFDPKSYASLNMMQDLRGRVTFCDQNSVIDLDRARSQIQTLVNLHAPFYESPELGSETIPFISWADWWPSMMKTSPEFGACCDMAFEESRDLIPARLYARRDEIWPATLQSAEMHRALPHTLIHCDVHLRNWYCTNDNVMGLGDWQITSTGHWSRDLIYALTTSLTVEDRRRWEKDLVHLYLDMMEERGVPRISDEQAWLYLRQQMMTVLAFWTITLHPAPGMPDMQPLATTREFLRRIYAAMDDHDALGAF